jgi:hypothetical protein
LRVKLKIMLRGLVVDIRLAPNPKGDGSLRK